MRGLQCTQAVMALLRALMPLVIGLTACSAYASNGGTFKPIDYRIEKPSGPAR